MAAYAPERESNRTRHQVWVAMGVGLLSVSTLYLGGDAQERIAQLFQTSLLRPFLRTQETLAQTRVSANQIEALQAQLDSLTAIVSTQAALAQENRSLRQLLGLAERASPSYLRATVIRPGTPGSESMFIVDVGRRDGVQLYAPVVSAQGLVGVIRDVRERDAVGMDWTHPDFRASAMLEDGSAFGMVENVRREFRELDRLMLTGTAYHESLPQGARVITSGLGVIPRGIPIGLVDETADVEGGWRKSYWLRPSVDPAAVTHVLVAGTNAPADVASLWAPDTVAVDALAADDEGTVQAPAR